MSTRATPSLDELRSQARRTFRTWPIYLMLRLRDVEQHLTPAQRAELGSVLGFGMPDPIMPLPESTTRDGRLTLLIEYGLLDVLRLELLRTEAAYTNDLKMAVTIFMDIQADVSSDAALEAARLWAALHGSRQLAWDIVKTSDREPNDPARPAVGLPPRRRGRGQFRSPS